MALQVKVLGANTRRRAVSLLVAASAAVGLAGPVAAADFHAGHPQVRITVAGGCPDSVARYEDVENPAGPLVRLVPTGPVDGLICRYGPYPLAPPSTGMSSSALYRAVHLGPSAARRLAGVADRLPTNSPPGLLSCPADFGAATVIAFSYRHRSDVDLWDHDQGCERLDNGHLVSFEPGNRLFYAVFDPLLDRLAPPPPAA